MAHKLLIDIQDSSYNNRFIHVRDYSVWDSVLTVRDRRFQILPPYSDQYYIIPLPENSLLSVSGTMIGLSADQDIPDGAYAYHYSVSPNHEVYVASCHYRIANLLNKVLGKMALVAVGGDESIDECGNVQIEKEEKVLIHILGLLNSAASVGRHNHLKAKADELYVQAGRQYAKLYENPPCGSC